MNSIIIISLLILILLNGCAKNVGLPEVNLIEQQEHALWKTKAYLYLPKEFTAYKERIRKTKDSLRFEESKIFPLRNYKPIQMEFLDIIKEGEDLLKNLSIELQKRALLILQRILRIEDKMDQINKYDT